MALVFKVSCCRLCSNGPCRITPEAPRGICGANADTIVTRNFLRAVASGSGCYIHIVENTALNLKKTAQIRGELKGLKSLDHLAELFGITDEDIYVKAEKSPTPFLLIYISLNMYPLN